MENDLKKCPICLLVLEREVSWVNDDAYEIYCTRCGSFKITRTAATVFLKRNYTDKQRIIASSFIRKTGYTFYHEKNDDIFSIQDISILDKCDNLLLYIEKYTEKAGIPIYWDNIVSYEAQAYSWAIDWKEMEGLAELLSQMGRLSIQKAHSRDARIETVLITANGWGHLEQRRAINTESNQGFVAMSFAGELRYIYDDAIAPAIKKAGYSPLRVDNTEHTGKIDDEIILQIRRSRFLVADATQHRGGVYYEAGFAHGLNLPVFWTCRKNHMKKLHFDVRQYNCIAWKDDAIEVFFRSLSSRIESVMGRGKIVG